MGSRLWRKTYTVPKTLLPFADGTILSTIMDNFHSVGISEFVIVVGYQANYIIDYLKQNEYLGYDVEIINNDDWNKGNGLSVLIAEKAVNNDDFILSMSDHIVSVSALKRIVDYPAKHSLLLVDPQINDIYDIKDATKVEFQESKIINIGKEIKQYNGVDCGIFKLNNRYFVAMREALKSGADSISAAVSILIKNDDMEAVFLKPQEKWIDIDTPDAYRHSLRDMGY